MPVEEREHRAAVVEALKSIDTATLQAIARETGFGERTLWRYRDGESTVPAARLLPLARALGLSSKRPRDADVA
jgi:hypothetical protein